MLPGDESGVAGPSGSCLSPASLSFHPGALTRLLSLTILMHFLIYYPFPLFLLLHPLLHTVRATRTASGAPGRPGFERMPPRSPRPAPPARPETRLGPSRRASWRVPGLRHRVHRHWWVGLCGLSACALSVAPKTRNWVSLWLGNIRPGQPGPGGWLLWFGSETILTRKALKQESFMAAPHRNGTRRLRHRPLVPQPG